MSHVGELHDVDNDLLWNAIRADPALQQQTEHILHYGSGDVEPSFLGFVGTYRRLAEIIPHHWSVYDCGCAYAFQAWYFRNHKAYIGVDVGVPTRYRLALPNVTHYHLNIEEFLRDHPPVKPAFGICNYVPTGDGGSGALVRSGFENCFVFYPEPSGDEREILKRLL